MKSLAEYRVTVAKHFSVEVSRMRPFVTFTVLMKDSAILLSILESRANTAGHSIQI